MTVINADLTYDVAGNAFPLVTTRKSFWKAAVAELLGYIRGYDNAEDFRKLGTKTWDANANLNDAWLNNPYRKGEDDMGRVYGVQGRAWAKPDGGHIDQLRKIVDDLTNGLMIAEKSLIFITLVSSIWVVCALACIATISHYWATLYT